MTDRDLPSEAEIGAAGHLKNVAWLVRHLRLAVQRLAGIERDSQAAMAAMVRAREETRRERDEAKQRVAALDRVLGAHRRYHASVGCPGGAECYVCSAEEVPHAET